MTDIGMEAKKKTDKAKTTPATGILAKPADDIAKVIKKESEHRKEGMGRINFYIHRAGKSLPKKDKEKLQLAKVILKRMYVEEAKKNKKVSNEAFDDVTEPMVDEPPSSMW